MSTVAAIRPDAWNLPLFVHVLAAMALVGALVVAAAYLVPAWRDEAPRALAAAFRTLLWAALPALIATRATAEWITREQGLAADPPTWVSMGYMTTDGGFAVLVIALIAARAAVRRTRPAGDRDGGGAGGAPVAGPVRLAIAATSILLLAYLVMVWAMTAKPG